MSTDVINEERRMAARSVAEKLLIKPGTTLWPILSELGLRPVTQVSIDQVWSALRFRPLRQGEAPFSGGRS
ncbi:MAG TPA: hypothetical protein VHS79_08535 [Actinomycetes bacterium]|nr:hypothetical protein [Actinomycetes bacterium]HEX2157012.1 hypothetical protein [Actinomycetes bacterium]